MLPNFIIIGAMKCATTSLHYYLNLHPQISMSSPKELNFFIRERNWPKGIEWYSSHFSGESKIFGEASVNYAAFPDFDGVPARMKAVVPSARLIYIIRDPIQRIISHYVHEVAADRENRAIEDALSQFEDNPYISRSMYYMQLEKYMEFFPERSILILVLEDLQTEVRATMSKTFQFLEVDPNFYSPKFHHKRHKSLQKRRKSTIGRRLEKTYDLKIARLFPNSLRWNIGWFLSIPFSRPILKPVLPVNLYTELGAYLKNDVTRIRKHTGNAFESWNIQ
jgi:hypothetical protein